MENYINKINETAPIFIVKLYMHPMSLETMVSPSTLLLQEGGGTIRVGANWLNET